MMAMATGYLRIGEFSERVGVSAERLRAWEQRYGLLAPDRSAGGFRLYSDDDTARVQRMRAHLERGISASEAARLAREAAAAPMPTGDTAATASLDASAGRLRERLEAYDDAGAHTVLDEALATFTVETVLRDVVLASLVAIGKRWASGELSVAQEHFASNLLRSRLLGLVQGWGQGVGPRVVLATPPGELHDLALIVCGLALSRQGVRVVFLGADCPIDTLETAVATLRPALVLLAALDASRLAAVERSVRALVDRVPVYLAGAGASAELAGDLGATYVGEDPVGAAPSLAGAALAPAP